MTLNDRVSLGEQVVDIPTPFPEEEQTKTKAQPGKYIVYSRTGRILGIQIAVQYGDTLVFTNYKKTTLPDLSKRSGTMFKREEYISLIGPRADYNLIFKLRTKAKVELVKNWNPDGFLKDYTLRDSFYS